MTNWDYDCPKYRDFLNSDDSDGSDVELYFDCARQNLDADRADIDVYWDALDKTVHANNSRPFTRSMASAQNCKGALKENINPAPRGSALECRISSSESALHTIKQTKPAKSKDQDTSTRATGAHISLAETIVTFHKKTPSRFHVLKARSRMAVQGATRKKPTVPVTPNLATKLRSRSVNIESQKQKEERIAQEMKRYQFRAQPVNAKVLLPKTAPSAKTAPTVQPMHRPAAATLEPALATLVRKTDAQPPTLRMSPRNTLRGARSRTSTSVDKFVARKAPAKVLKGPTFKLEKTSVKPTCPKSPAFSLKQRSENWKQKKNAQAKEEVKQTRVTRGSRPLKRLGTGKARMPHSLPPHQRTTTPQPFSFQERQEEAMRRKNEKLARAKAEEELKATRFHAQPVPNPAKHFHPRSSSAPPTSARPFQLASMAKHELKIKQFQDKVKKMEEECISATKFKAHPCPSFKAFKPKSSRKHTVPDKVQLHSTHRAQRRLKFDSERLSRQEEQAAQLKALQKQRQAEEEAALRQLRQKIVHKARPAPKAVPMRALRSRVPPTVPEMPNTVSKRLRLDQN